MTQVDWRHRPRISWLTQPVNGPCSNPACELPIATTVGWTLADARDHRSSGFWCAECFPSLLEFATAVGLAVEVARSDPTEVDAA
jgi:hypothetical protein